METTVRTCSRKGCENEFTAKHSWCNPCRVAWNKEYRKNNPEKVAGWKTSTTPYDPEYYQKNKEAIAAQQRAWREANPETFKESQRRWRAANEGHTYESPEGYVKYIGYQHPATNPSGVTPQHRIILWDKLNGADAVPCNWGCGKTLYWNPSEGQEKLFTDHVNTVKNDNRPENLVPTCHNCNVTREGGQNRPNKIAGKCFLEFCDRDANNRIAELDVVACRSHYNQHRNGKAFGPIRDQSPRGSLDDEVAAGERLCRQCQTVKPLDAFYIRNGRPKGACKVCESARSREAMQRRLAKAEPCDVDGCDSPSYSKSLCSLHYGRMWATGEVGPVGRKPPTPPSNRKCSLEECDNKYAAKGYCMKHYQQNRKANIERTLTS